VYRKTLERGIGPHIKGIPEFKTKKGGGAVYLPCPYHAREEIREMRKKTTSSLILLKRSSPIRKQTAPRKRK